MPSPSSASAALDGLVDGDAAGDDGDVVALVGDAAAADPDVLVGRRADRRLAAQRAHERDALACRPSRPTSCGGLVGVARVQDGRAVDRRGTTRCPRAPSATGRPRRSRRRRASPRAGCRRARSPPSGRSRTRARRTPRTSRRTAPSRAPGTDGGGDHLLLGDEHLEVAVLVGLAEVLGVRRVGDLAVERHDVAAARAERGQRLAVGLAGGDLLAELPRRQLGVRGLEAVPLAARRLGAARRAGRARRPAPRSPPRARRAACRACPAGPRPP